MFCYIICTVISLIKSSGLSAHIELFVSLLGPKQKDRRPTKQQVIHTRRTCKPLILFRYFVDVNLHNGSGANSRHDKWWERKTESAVPLLLQCTTRHQDLIHNTPKSMNLQYLFS